MGMTDWVCKFEQKSSIEDEMQQNLSRSGVLGYTSTKGAAGTFSIPEQNEVVISYSATLLKYPVGLVSTLAHELCHYLLSTVQEEPPATWKELEPLTDLSAVLEGFGLFQCNSAFQFDQWSSNDKQGWSAKRKGYLSEAELGFSFAIFCVRNHLDPNPAIRLLKPNPREVFCDALDFISELEESENQT